MKTYFVLAGLLSIQVVAAADNCRLAIHDLDKLIGQNAQLSDQVTKKLEKKNITLIDESELSEGDFHIPGLIAVYNGKPNIPIHEYKFKTKSRIGLVPCVAFPLCSPVYTENEVTDISGIKYKHDYSIKLITSSKPKDVIYNRFSHSYNDELVSWQTDSQYDGSMEQEDLALAIAEDIPKCSKLNKGN